MIFLSNPKKLEELHKRFLIGLQLLGHLFFTWNCELCCDFIAKFWKISSRSKSGFLWQTLYHTVTHQNSVMDEQKMPLEDALRTWSYPAESCHPRSLYFDNCAFLPNSCLGSRGNIIKYLLCQNVDLLYRAFSVNQMFLPTDFPFKTQPDSSYSTFGLIHAESSLPFWLFPSSLSNYWGSKLIK